MYYICTYTYIFFNKQIQPAQSIQYYPYIYDLRADYWYWIANMGVLPWRRYLLSVVLCLGLKLERPPFHVSMCLAVILVRVLFRQPCWWGFMGGASLSFLGHNFQANSMYSLSARSPASIPEPRLEGFCRFTSSDGVSRRRGGCLAWAHYTQQADLRLTQICQCLPSNCWDGRCGPPHPADNNDFARKQGQCSFRKF